MPGRSYNKVEAKYNVTTEFPSLGLHSAAATGNLGLAEYALGNGQPINSVLDGVLPLHAACAGGHVQIVKLLIERGADVNAPRLPRRYSNDKNRDSTAPIVGTSGSTPLHFAAANGNTNVVTLLLLHGAHADRPDKHGVTPEMLAKQHGWLESAQVLREWMKNKDRDLREREASIPWESSTTLRSSRSRDTLSSDAELSSSPQYHRRCLQVKHSIDTALNILKSSSSAFESNKASLRNVPFTPSPPASPTRPVAESSANPDSPADGGLISPPDSGPNSTLPQASLQAPPRSRKTSNPSSNSSFFTTRRPRSAGTDAECEEEDTPTTFSRNPTGRRLGSKYSLINMFKKSQSDIPTGTLTPDFRPGSSPRQVTTVQGSQAASSYLSVPSQQIKSIQETKRDAGLNGFNHVHRGSDASSLSQSSPRSIDRRNLPNLDDAVQEDFSQRRVLGDARTSSSPVSILSGILKTKDNNRERSGSNGSSYSIQTNRHLSIKDETPNGNGSEVGRGISRPSILRSHTRSSSSGQGTPLSSSYRALRFEQLANDGNDTEHSEQQLRSVNSAASLVKLKRQQEDSGRVQGKGTNTISSDLHPVSAPADVPEFGARAQDNNFGNGASPHHHTDSHPPTEHTISRGRRGSGSSSISSSSSSSASLAENEGRISESPANHVVLLASEEKNDPTALVFSAADGDVQVRTATSTSGFSSRSAVEIDIRTISSHAQAEALVQQAQKEILEMGEQEIFLSEGSEGSIPLSARLAAYGESLALEKKLREEMENTKVGQAEPTGHPIGNGSSRLTDRVARQHSPDEISVGRKERCRQMYLKPLDALDPYLSVETAKADRGTNSLDYVYQPTEIVDADLISPVDSLEQDPLNSSPSRVSKAPLSGLVVDRSAVEQARTVKLTKMGFAPSEQASRLPPNQTKSFGGISFKNIMQTFKGKS